MFTYVSVRSIYKEKQNKRKNERNREGEREGEKRDGGIEKENENNGGEEVGALSVHFICNSRTSTSVTK